MKRKNTMKRNQPLYDNCSVFSPKVDILPTNEFGGFLLTFSVKNMKPKYINKYVNLKRFNLDFLAIHQDQ